jgi:aminoglycoside phosphotransferase family enzyme/predicted kinase
MGFLDFSTVEKRRAACEAEVRLNQRLSEGVYLGIVPVTRDPDGGHRFGGPGEVVDWAVHMRRLPDGNRADVRLSQDRLHPEEVEAIAGRLARFHQASPPTAEAARFGGVETVRRNVEENFEQTARDIGSYLEPDQVQELERWQMQFLEERQALFEERLGSGRVRDGHGDLRLEHVYIDEGGGITIIDCIEFNERFRYADVCADVVFLAMDLAFHRRVDLAERFLAAYAREANDYDLYPLVDFYESYRAFVRGKISSFLVSNPAIPHEIRQRASAEARRYFLLALSSGRRSVLPPAVVAVGGLIASGKSTVASRIGALMTAPVVDADRTRKHLAGLAPETPARVAPFRGIYSPEFTEKAYGEVFRRADAVLASRRPVVLDASFHSQELRSGARKLAAKRGVPFTFVECRAPEEVLRRRLAERETKRGVSDGRLEIFYDFLARWEPVEELPPENHVLIDTSRPLDETETTLRARIPLWPSGFTG